MNPTDKSKVASETVIRCRVSFAASKYPELCKAFAGLTQKGCVNRVREWCLAAFLLREADIRFHELTRCSLMERIALADGNALSINGSSLMDAISATIESGAESSDLESHRMLVTFTSGRDAYLVGALKGFAEDELPARIRTLALIGWHLTSGKVKTTVVSPVSTATLVDEQSLSRAPEPEADQAPSAPRAHSRRAAPVQPQVPAEPAEGSFMATELAPPPPLASEPAEVGSFTDTLGIV